MGSKKHIHKWKRFTYYDGTDGKGNRTAWYKAKCECGTIKDFSLDEWLKLPKRQKIEF